MIPWNLLGRTTTPGGDELALMHQPGEFLILAGGKPLMSSRMHGSEEAMAEVACRRPGALDAPTVLIGGLGMGFTLRATLDAAAGRRRRWSWPSWWPASWSGTAVRSDIWPTIRCRTGACRWK